MVKGILKKSETIPSKWNSQWKKYRELAEEGQVAPTSLRGPITNIEVIDKGSGYKKGDTVKVKNSDSSGYGKNATFTVEEVDEKGGIEKINLTNGGEDYMKYNTIEDRKTKKGSGSGAKLVVSSIKMVNIDDDSIKCKPPLEDIDSRNLIMMMDSIDWVENLEKPVKDWAVKNKKRKDGTVYKSYPCTEGDDYIQINPENGFFCCANEETKKELDRTPNIFKDDLIRLGNKIKKWIPDQEIWDQSVSDFWRRNIIEYNDDLKNKLDRLDYHKYPEIQLATRGFVVLSKTGSIKTLTIEEAGSSYQKDEKGIIINGNGSGAEYTVEEIDDNGGGIKKLNLTNKGRNYMVDDIIEIRGTGTGTGARFKVSTIKGQFILKKKEDLEFGDKIDLSAVNSPSKILGKILAQEDEDYSTKKEFLSKEQRQEIEKILSDLKKDPDSEEIKMNLIEFNKKLEKENNDLIVFLRKSLIGNTKIKAFFPVQSSLSGKLTRANEFNEIQNLHEKIMGMSNVIPVENSESIKSNFKDINEKIVALKLKLEPEIKVEQRIKLILDYKSKLEDSGSADNTTMVNHSPRTEMIADRIVETISDPKAGPPQHISILYQLILDIEADIIEKFNSLKLQIEISDTGPDFIILIISNL